jgi:glycosyltransferase involved in cell wall biosynthesis
MRGQHGHINITSNSTVYSVPHLEDILGMIDPGDIVVARGGFKPWYNVLNEIRQRGNWILFYRANTNRHSWPFWDVILNDLIPMPIRAGNRLHFNFSKPVNEDLFFHIPGTEKKYDVLLNASHIHTKKGQHRFIRAAIEYQKMFGKDISICLPGGFIRSWAKGEILNNIEEYSLAVYMPGGVPREKLNILMNESRFYVHIGTGGQNDRGCLEAMRCGLPVMLSNKKAFAPFVYANQSFSSWVPVETDNTFVAQQANEMLKYCKEDPSIYEKTAQYYLQENGLHKVAVPKMTELFNNIFEIGKPDREKILKRYMV